MSHIKKFLAKRILGTESKAYQVYARKAGGFEQLRNDATLELLMAKVSGTYACVAAGGACGLTRLCTTALRGRAR